MFALLTVDRSVMAGDVSLHYLILGINIRDR